MNTKNNVKPQVEEDVLFSEAGNVKFDYVKFETPGDRVKGVYVGKYQSTSQKYGYEQMNYVLLTENGEKKVVSGRNTPKGSDVRIIFGMDKIPLGAVMGFIYTGDKDTGKGNPAKLIEPKYLGERDMETLEKFQEMYQLDDFKEVATAEEADVPTVPEEEF